MNKRDADELLNAAHTSGFNVGRQRENEKVVETILKEKCCPPPEECEYDRWIDDLITKVKVVKW